MTDFIIRLSLAIIFGYIAGYILGYFAVHARYLLRKRR